MRRRRWLAAAAAALLAALLAYWLLPPRLAAVQVRAQPLEQRLVATGQVMSPERIALGAVVVGTVAEVRVDEGETVAPGQLLIRLRSEEATAAVDGAEAALAQARAELRQLERAQRPQATEASTQAALELAQARRDFERARTLAAEGFASRAEAEARQEALELAASRLRSARQALADLQTRGSGYQAAAARAAAAEAALLQARARLDYTRLRAPVAATVLARLVEPGDVVQPGTPLLRLASAGDTLIEFQLDERNLGRLRLGQPALISADAFPEQSFRGVVSFIGPAVDPERATVEAKLTVPHPPAYLRSDMTVSVDVLVGRREQALAVPRSAVHREPGGSWVLVVRDGRARRQPVRLGLVGDERVELTAGIIPGEWLLRDPRAVAPGARVRLQAPAP